MRAPAGVLTAAVGSGDGPVATTSRQPAALPVPTAVGMIGFGAPTSPDAAIHASGSASPPARSGSRRHLIFMHLLPKSLSSGLPGTRARPAPDGGTGELPLGGGAGVAERQKQGQQRGHSRSKSPGVAGPGRRLIQAASGGADTDKQQRNHADPPRWEATGQSHSSECIEARWPAGTPS